jgi:hypothetical protein
MMAMLFGVDDRAFRPSKPALLDTSLRHLLAFDNGSSPHLVHVFSRDFIWTSRSWLSVVLYYIIFHVAYLSKQRLNSQYMLQAGLNAFGRTRDPWAIRVKQGFGPTSLANAA